MDANKPPDAISGNMTAGELDSPFCFIFVKKYYRKLSTNIAFAFTP